MVRALVLAAFICVCCSFLNGADARWTIRPRPTRTTTIAIPKSTTSRPRPRPRPTTTTTTTTTTVPIGVDLVVDDGAKDEDRTYHPAEVLKPRLIEQFDSRSLDGHYEYRYVLSNGDTRYERAYWLPVGHTKVLARKGYYSYPLPNREFLTVFYTADHQGYRQDSSTFTKFPPVLPRSLDVPEYEPPKVNEYEHHQQQQYQQQHQHHKHSHKLNKGYGSKPTTEAVSQIDSVKANENSQDAALANDVVVAVKEANVTPTAARTTTAELQQKLRKQNANDVAEIVPVATDSIFSKGVHVDNEQQQQQNSQETIAEESSEEAGAATTVAVDVAEQE